jgi:hypothetical protein
LRFCSDMLIFSLFELLGGSDEGDEMIER